VEGKSFEEGKPIRIAWGDYRLRGSVNRVRESHGGTHK